MKIRGSYQIAIAAVLLGGGSYYGWQLYSARTVDSKVFSELEPGEFSIIGVKTGAGYKIIVSNQIAQLVQLTEADEFGVEDITQTENDTGTNKRRVPLRDLLKTLQGDEPALGRLITTMNDPLRMAEMPGTEVIWKAADIKKALAGDAALVKKLEIDLNVDLKGRPLNDIRPSSLRNGIVIESLIPIEVSVGGKSRTMKGPVKIPFRPMFCIDVEKGYREELEPTKEMIQGHYLAVAQQLDANPKEQQNIAEALRQRTDEALLAKSYSEGPSRVLSNSKVILNEKYIDSATLDETTAAQKTKLYNLALNLTPEGKDRLWQFSRKGNIGAQLLVIHNGIAIAAPRIRHELAQSSVSITQLPERSLAQETVDFLNSKGNK